MKLQSEKSDKCTQNSQPQRDELFTRLVSSNSKKKYRINQRMPTIQRWWPQWRKSAPTRPIIRLSWPVEIIRKLTTIDALATGDGENWNKWTTMSDGTMGMWMDGEKKENSGELFQQWPVRHENLAQLPPQVVARRAFTNQRFFRSFFFQVAELSRQKKLCP